VIDVRNGDVCFSYINVINSDIYKRSCSSVTFVSSTLSPTRLRT